MDFNTKDRGADAVIQTESQAEVALPPHALGQPRTLASWFESTAARHPKRVAVTAGETSLTYAELLDRSGRLARRLCHRGIGPESLVAILLDRTPEMIIAMLAVIRAGAAYLPLDPSYPASRLTDTLADAQPAVVFTDRTRASSLPADVVMFADDSADGPPSLPPASAIDPDHLAYVIYTSGSTGKPKGVMVTQRNVVRLFEQTEPWFGFGPDDVWTLFHSFAFDFSVWEIWGALLYGGRLVLVPFETSRNPETFHRLLARERVTVLNQTPTAFSLLMAADAAAYGNSAPLALRTVIFGGEALNLRSLLGWFERHGDQTPRLINMYGITETTVHVTWRPITLLDAQREHDSLIGQPIPDLRLDLLDATLHLVPDGETGEICIGGPGVTRGYLNRTELTRERFVADPRREGGRLYRSGDLARRRPDGELVYMGRADRQVKINGFRIELGEIEAALATLPELHQVCAVAHGQPGAQRIAVFFAADPTLTSAALRRHADATLPPHMRPSFLTRLDRLPLDPNGKVDRKALPAPEAMSTPAPSASQLEREIAALWSRLLEVTHVSPETNFFDLGGGSLELIRLRSELTRLFSVDLPVTALFEHTTVRSLANRIAQAQGQAADSQVQRPPAATNRRAEQQRVALDRLRAAREVR